MKTDISINVLDILNKGIADAIESAVNKRVNEARADFNTRLEVIELHYEAQFASYNAELKELHNEFVSLLDELNKLKAPIVVSQESLFNDQKNDGAEANEVVRVIATDFLNKCYGNNGGAFLIGKSTESVVNQFYAWCKANRIELPNGKGQKRVVTNTAKTLFNLKLINHHKLYARADAGDTNVER